MSNLAKVIVALDFADAQQALDFAMVLDPAACKLKVGFELFVTAGPSLVSQLVERGFDVFLDLKFHDIPNTVASVCQAAAKLGVWMINVHAAGGQRMLEAAREGLDGESHRPKLIAVTVLTSMADTDLQGVGVERSTKEQALLLGALAQSCGLDGVVCSALEAADMRRTFGQDFLLVTPGIRPAHAQSDDQRRVMTPTDAVDAGADYLVIGRPITRADHPSDVLARVNRDLGILT